MERLTDEDIASVMHDLTVDTPAVRAVPEQRETPRKAVRRAEGRTGRSAFVSPICEAHPDWEDDFGTVTVADGEHIHCAKFGHLPGGGRGIVQPAFYRVFIELATEMAKPVALIGLLLGAFFVLNATLLSGSFLRSGSDVRPSECSVSNGVGNATANTNSASGKCDPDRTSGDVRNVRPSSVAVPGNK